MEVRILTTEAMLAELRHDWRDLCRRAARTVFEDPEWFECWWQFLGKPGKPHLHVAVGMEGGRLVAVAPLIVAQRRGVRILQWAGTETFDYCDSTLEHERYGPPLWQAIARSSGFDIARLDDVRPDAACRPALNDLARPVRERQARHIRIEDPSGEAWFGTALSSSARSLFRRRIRQYEGSGVLAFEVTRGPRMPSDVLEALVRHKRAWHAQRGQIGIVDRPGAVEFVRRLAAAAAERGVLHLSALRCGDQIVATHFGFLRQGILLQWFPAYAPSWKRLSPGTVLLFKLISWCADNGVREFDFMRGDEDYKDKIANGTRTLTTFSFTKTARGQVAQLLASRVWEARRVRANPD